MTLPPDRSASFWDQRYRDGLDGWELGRAAPPLEAFLRDDPRAPRPAGPVLVPGCGRGHEAALLADLGHPVVALDFSAEAIQRGERLHGTARPHLRWLRADVLDVAALDGAGVTSGSLGGVVEHTCFCALDPHLRTAYLETLTRLLAPGGWLLALFWCHSRPGGPPWGSAPEAVAESLSAAGLRPGLWEPAQGSAEGRDAEWLGLWWRPGQELRASGRESRAACS